MDSDDYWKIPANRSKNARSFAIYNNFADKRLIWSCILVASITATSPKADFSNNDLSPFWNGAIWRVTLYRQRVDKNRQAEIIIKNNLFSQNVRDFVQFGVRFIKTFAFWSSLLPVPRSRRLYQPQHQIQKFQRCADASRQVWILVESQKFPHLRQFAKICLRQYRLSGVLLVDFVFKTLSSSAIFFHLRNTKIQRNNRPVLSGRPHSSWDCVLRYSYHICARQSRPFIRNFFPE